LYKVNTALSRTLRLTLRFDLLPPLPSQWRVRKEAMMGLASIYRKYSLQGEGGRDASKQISWIKDKLLHIYYQNSIDDRWVGGSSQGEGPPLCKGNRPLSRDGVRFLLIMIP